MRFCIAVLLLLPTALRADEDLSVLTAAAAAPPRKMLHDYLIGECQKHFDARRTVIAALKNSDDVKTRQDALRKQFIDAIGGFPEKTPLNAKVVGTLIRDGYSIEKVVFESRPGHHVTANLYLPAGKGPFPVVLMPIGHSNNGKASFQGTATLLTKNGMAAFPYDPISQGERKQLLDEKGKPFIANMTAEHTLIGVGALLAGGSTAGYRIWDGMRAIDYLVSRPDIDGKRIGCTGCSGGGTLTSYLMALDERILAAAPSCYITSLERLFATIGPQDAEQNITGQVAFGMDHADYILMRAPKPTILLASTNDFFNIDGTWATFREAKQVCTKLGFPERVDMIETDATHGYPKAHKEAMLRFMSRWLLGKEQTIVEEPVELVKEADLLCTRTGQVLEEFKGKSCFDLNAERAKELAKRRANSPESISDKTIAEVIKLKLPVTDASMKGVGNIARKDYTIFKRIYETEPDISVPALLFEKNPKEPLVVYLHDRGKAIDAAPGGPIEKLVLSGWRVLAIDPRGMGETSAGVVSEKRSQFGVDFTNGFLGLHLDRPLLGQRVFDVLSVIKKTARENEEIELIGIGNAAPIALHVAALDSRIKQTTLEKGVLSWANVVATPVNLDQLTNVVPNVLKHYDLPDLAASLAPRGLTIRSAVDAAGKPVALKALEAEYAAARAAYAKAKQEKRLVLE